MPTYQYDLFDDTYNATPNRNNQPEIPALLLHPVLHRWNRYDEGTWDDCYDCL